MAMLLAGTALTLGLGACGGGSGSPINGELHQAAVNKLLCDPPGMTIKLRNSGISCEQAGAMLVVLSSGGETQVVREQGGREWVCRDLSRPGYRDFLKCSQGKRFFTVQSAERGEH